MLDWSVLPGFVALILVFLAPPGPDMTYMLAVGLQGGPRAAARAILGIGTGMAVYAAAVALGLGAVATAYPEALTVVKIGGALYLLWLAVSTVRHAREAAEVDGPPPGRWYVRGLLVSLTNPKLILFFLAVLPRFVGDARSTTAQLALLGAVNVACEVVLYGGIGLAAGTLHRRFAARPGAQRTLHLVAAVVYLALAVVLVLDVVRDLA